MKWQRWQVDYLSEKSMLIMKFKIFYQDFIGFLVKMIIFELIMRYFFITWGRNYRWFHYSIAVSGTFTCFFIELSKPIFCFALFFIFRCCFVWKMPYETKSTVWTKNSMSNQVTFSIFRNIKSWIFWKSKIGFDSSLKKHLKVSETTTE